MSTPRTNPSTPIQPLSTISNLPSTERKSKCRRKIQDVLDSDAVSKIKKSETEKNEYMNCDMYSLLYEGVFPEHLDFDSIPEPQSPLEVLKFVQQYFGKLPRQAIIM